MKEFCISTESLSDSAKSLIAVNIRKPIHNYPVSS